MSHTILLFLFLQGIIINQSQERLLVDFDNTGVVFESFGSAKYMRSINPNPDQLNTSDFVGSLVYNQTYEDEAGGIYLDFEEPIDVSSGCTIQIKIFIHSEAKMVVKLEDSGIPDYQIKKEKRVIPSNNWQSLRFSFKPVEGFHDRLTIVFFPIESTLAPFYVDDILIE